MKDGLYQVNYPKYKGTCAGFVVKNGQIVAWAPILRANKWLLKFAERVE